MKISLLLLIILAGCSSSKKVDDSSTTIRTSPSDKKNNSKQYSEPSSVEMNGLPEAVKYDELAKQIKLKDWDKVEQQATVLLGSNSKDKVVFNALGLTNYIRNKPKAARYFFNQALAIDANSSEVFNNLGLVSQMEGNQREAIFFWRKAISLNKNNINAFINLVSEFSKVKDYRKVVAAAEIVNTKDLKHIPSLINIAVAYAANNQLDEAESFYKKALELDGNNQIILINSALFYIEHKQNTDLGRKYLDRLAFLGVQSNIQASFDILENKLSMKLKAEQPK